MTHFRLMVTFFAVFAHMAFQYVLIYALFVGFKFDYLIGIAIFIAGLFCVMNAVVFYRGRNNL